MPLGNLQRISLSTPIIEKHNYFNTIKAPTWTGENNWLVPPVDALLGWSNTSLFALLLVL